MVSSPPWHRRERKHRARARKRLKHPPKSYTPGQAVRDLALLETHHSRPKLLVARRRMAEWASQKWSGQYRGSKKGKARKAQGGSAQKEQKNRQKDAGKFPSYDTMDVETTEQSTGSSSSAASGDQVWQSTLRCLLQSNPGLAIPKEISTALESIPKKDS